MLDHLNKLHDHLKSLQEVRSKAIYKRDSVKYKYYQKQYGNKKNIIGINNQLQSKDITSFYFKDYYQDDNLLDIIALLIINPLILIHVYFHRQSQYKHYFQAKGTDIVFKLQDNQQLIIWENLGIHQMTDITSEMITFTRMQINRIIKIMDLFHYRHIQIILQHKTLQVRIIIIINFLQQIQFQYLMIFLFIIHLVSCKINYDKGVFKKMDIGPDATFDCRNELERTFIIPFSDSFENIPQVFFFWNFLCLNTFSEFQIEIKQISLINFILFVKCPLPTGQVRSVMINWYAIDDQRIEIINSFNMEKPKNQTHLHKNPNAQVAILSLTSFGFEGPLEFLISIANLTETFVQVEISNPTEKLNNLKHLGYQIIIGIKEAFLDLGLETVSQNSTFGYVPQVNSWFITPYQGFIYDHSFAIRLQTIFYSNNSYTFQTCIKIYKLGTFPYFVPFTYRKVWISFSFQVTFYSIELKNLIITSRQEEITTLNPYFNIYIIQNQSIFNTQGTYTSIINKLHQEIDLSITVKCSPNYIVKSQFFKISKTYKFSHQCLPIEYNLKYIANMKLSKNQHLSKTNTLQSNIIRDCTYQD
ncbi:unnamed protein product [Paramecium sonneborni]|uniref:H-type lectin domain-containing protein n=1 Tax=Paramecium sonneborni TaxID=65129 RepID=A0A8S1P2T0_9CILI|nr:unnamed protein product [Paramecium sonneborni]